MRCNIMGKGLNVSNDLKEKVQNKLGRLSRVFPEDCEAQVTLKVENITNIVEVTIPLKKRMIRAEVKSSDMMAAVDEVTDVLEKQMVKYKNRLRDRGRVDNSFKEEFISQFSADDTEDTNKPSHIEKTKRFALKPMDSEEAVMEMELLDHSFFVFRNGESDDINVVYKRRNGTYGLIEPEY